MAELPTGTVTLLFTDIEGSTTRWQAFPDAMRSAVPRHDEILRAAIESNRGYVFRTVGDAFCAAFATAPDALNAALQAQYALTAEAWREIDGLRVRMALNTGAVERYYDDYSGLPLNRVARLISAGHGGQVLLSLATQELVRDDLPVGVTLRDMGEHRLKDLIRPERIFQLVAPRLGSDFPPLKTLDNRPHNLPLQRMPLIGREKEAQSAQNLLLRQDAGLLTLTGPGGTGKTRLALQVAADVLDHFSDGVFFVALAPISDPDFMAVTIAYTLGVKEKAEQPLLESVKQYLKDKQLLLVLDNFEHIIEAAPVVAELLAACSQLRVLVTSRSALRLHDEQEFPVPPLAIPDLKRLPPLELLSQYAAVELFIQRALAVKPDFTITNETAPAVAEICARLDGLPLAIELAAARVKLLPPRALLDRLQNRLKLLTGGARDLPARHQTLHATIAWSYDLLEEAEKKLFRRLAVFAGGCTVEAAEAVCNGADDLEADVLDVLDGLALLVDKSLLRQQEQEDESAEPRFLMLETVREYGLEKLKEGGETAAIRKRHAEFFGWLFYSTGGQATGPEQAGWLRRVDAEQDNVRTALAWSLQCGEMPNDSEDGPPDIRVQLTLPYERYLAYRGYASERRSVMEALLRSYRGEGYWMAIVLQMAGHLEEALAIYENVCVKLGSDSAGAKALRNCEMRNIRWALAEDAREQGDFATFHSCAEEALSAAQELGDKKNIAKTLFELGTQAMVEGDFATAQQIMEENVRVLRELGSPMNVSYSLLSLAKLACYQADYQRAKEVCEEDLALIESVGIGMHRPWVLPEAGRVARHEGSYQEAIKLFKESLTLQRESTLQEINPRLIATHLALTTLSGLAGVLAESGDPQQAAQMFGAVEANYKSSGIFMIVGDRTEFERDMAIARAALDETTFTAAWAQGQTMTLEQAVESALNSELKIEI